MSGEVDNTVTGSLDSRLFDLLTDCAFSQVESGYFGIKLRWMMVELLPQVNAKLNGQLMAPAFAIK